MLKKRSLILVEIESTAGTDANPTPADNAILVSSPDVKVNGETLERDFDRASMSPLEHIIGAGDIEFTFRTEFKGSGSANGGAIDDVPEVHPLFLASGMGATLTAESSADAKDGHIVYHPASTAHKTATIYFYNDGLLFKSRGCMGTFKLVMDTGKMPEIEWTFKGTFETPTDADIPTTAVYSAEKAKPFVGANFSVGGYAAIIESLAIDIANSIERRVDANAPEGVLGFLITGRDTQGSFNPESVKEATHPFWANWKGGQAMALTATVGKGTGSLIDITAPKVQYREVTMGDRNGIRTYEIPCRLAMDSGDDELKLKFY